jgi:hypothetical protein
MIKITVDPEKDPKTYSFEKPGIVIGEGSMDAVDICFPSEGLHQTHLRILQKDTDYLVVNQANDPFVTLNGESFGKKKIKIGDLLQIRDHILRIDELQAEAPIQMEESKPAVLVEKEPVETLILEPLPKKREPPPKIPRKNIYKWAFAFIFAFIAILSITALEIYFRGIKNNTQEETLAAESLADYAMALTFAKVYHVSPEKQSWMDPQFIKNNLVDLLSTSSIPCGNIDTQGQFANCPYLLRFYTNQDFSRYILIAQPSPSFIQWLIPKKTLIVDSSEMVLHKTHDLHQLNRLLSSRAPLDGQNGDELTKAINKTEIISLKQLAEATKKKEFAPPLALSYILPGADNLIYNAPRYHSFSETFLKKILNVSNENSHELAVLQSELDTLSKFHDLVFYSSSGMKKALQGFQALKKLSSKSNFFAAYLIFTKDGVIANSHLVIDKPLPEDVISEESFETAMVVEEAPRKHEGDAELLASLLSKQATVAQTKIRPFLLQLSSYLSNAIEKDSIYLDPTFFQILNNYEKAVGLAKSELADRLTEFRKEHSDLNEFIIERLLREYGLLDLYQSPSFSIPKKRKVVKMSLGKMWKSKEELLSSVTKRQDFPQLLLTPSFRCLYAF